jgi:hypothetical protein
VLGPLDYVIWVAGLVLEVGVVVCAIRKGALRQYPSLNLYMAASAAASIGRFIVLQSNGVTSLAYTYFYYYSDSLLTVLLFLSLTSLFARVFDEIGAERSVKFGAVFLLIATALFSYGVVYQAGNRLMSRFVIEMSQNLYFVGVVLTYILWGAILKLRETRARLVQLVLSLGIYFSLCAAVYALRNLYPQWHAVTGFLMPIIGCFLPLAWAYAFWHLPEEARLTPSRLAVTTR